MEKVLDAARKVQQARVLLNVAPRFLVECQTSADLNIALSHLKTAERFTCLALRHIAWAGGLTLRQLTKELYGELTEGGEKDANDRMRREGL